jgi:hypothetical protein
VGVGVEVGIVEIGNPGLIEVELHQGKGMICRQTLAGVLFLAL